MVIFKKLPYMTIFKRRLNHLLMIMSVIGFIASCSNETSKPNKETNDLLVGLWQPESEKTKGTWVEFKAAGIFSVGSYEETKYSGKWTRTDDSLIMTNDKEERMALNIESISETECVYHQNNKKERMLKLSSLPQHEDEDLDEAASDTEDTLSGLVKSIDEFYDEFLPRAKKGDTIIFDGNIRGKILLKNKQDLTLLGRKNTFLFSEDEYAIMIELVNCKNIKVDGFYSTHFPAPKECMDGVIKVVDCDNITISNNDISGSGLYGIKVLNSKKVRIENNAIHDCSYMGIEIDNKSINYVVRKN